MSHFTAFSLSCLFWALFAFCHNATSASSQYMQTPEKYQAGSGDVSRAQQHVAMCQAHFRLIAEFKSEEAASADFEAFVETGDGMASVTWYVEMVRAMIKAYYSGDHEGAYKGCLQKALESA